MPMDNRIMPKHKLLKKMTAAFGDILDWPPPSRKKPYFINFLAARRERLICQVLGLDEITEDMRERFWRQMGEGQGYTDATGYRERCWLAMMRLPFLPSSVSYSAIMYDVELCRKFGVDPHPRAGKKRRKP